MSQGLSALKNAQFARCFRLAAIAVAIAALPLGSRGQRPIPPGVEKICVIKFSKDTEYPARVEDSALACLNEAADKLKKNLQLKLVLVGTSHPVFDHAEKDAGMERETEDTTGRTIRFEDVAAYRAVNTKQYLTQWYGIDPSRVIPTTDEYQLAREVTVFAVPGRANFLHNYLNTTPCNEAHCTVKPCYNPHEDTLAAQVRSRIDPGGDPSAK
jgi:hypothetical protein